MIRWARGYDLLVWFFLGGRERAFREKLATIAQLKPGERVLDVGCGTGSLAIIAKQRVGVSGESHGIDPSPEMIARAQMKARRAGVDVKVREGAAQELPYPDAHFEVVTSTMMLHHLRRDDRVICAQEMRRVLKPGGRLLAVDFNSPGKKRGIIGHFHRHGHTDVRYLTELIEAAGLTLVKQDGVGVRDLQFVLATRP